mgnify:FL=1
MKTVYDMNFDQAYLSSGGWGKNWKQVNVPYVDMKISTTDGDTITLPMNQDQVAAMFLQLDSFGSAVFVIGGEQYAVKKDEVLVVAKALQNATYQMGEIE